ncbi:MAG TPA: class I SAM-dependent methyltransferase [Chitinophagaceae bacterium]|nr:class I SAM-dependent methyltransferase [Chitinophagaceae bacterium]
MKIGFRQLEYQWRRQLLASAKGHILEPFVGTGKNFRHYPKGIKVTATDTSERMMKLARVQAEQFGIQSSFIVSPLQELQFPPQSFDTIVSTFSLGEFENPGLLLNLYNEWCKPEGEVLLLEYGLSRYGLVRWLQKKWEPFQYRNSGIHMNRDMLGIIAGSNLVLKKVDIKYAGTVYLVWAELEPAAKKTAFSS